MEQLFLLLILLILSAFFSGAEIAIFSLGEEKIAALKKNKKNNSQLNYLIKIKENPQQSLATILLGNNVVNIAATTLATVISGKWAAESGLESDTTLLIVIVTGIMTFLILFFGEITPKSIAHRYSLKYSLFAAPILFFLGKIFFIIVYPLEKILQKISGEDKEGKGLNEDELKIAMAISEQDGKINESERQWAEKILNFDNFSVEKIMTPRAKIFYLEDDDSVNDAIKIVLKKGHSRVPIFHEEHPIGVLSIWSLAEYFALSPKNDNTKVANLQLLPPLNIPMTMKIDKLLHVFQQESKHMAFVVDEHGGTIGLITMEDILEEIFGEIKDEQDSENNENSDMRRTGKNIFTFSADTELEQVENFINEQLEKESGSKINFPWQEEMENETLSYLILQKLERFPEQKEAIKIFNEDGQSFIFNIEKMTENTIKTIKIDISKSL